MIGKLKKTMRIIADGLLERNRPKNGKDVVEDKSIMGLLSKVSIYQLAMT